MDKINRVRFFITISLLLIAFIHTIFPNIKIDIITLSLIIMSIIPWLAPLFKSLEFPGGFKFEFQEFEKITEKAKDVGLINNQINNTTEYNFIDIAETNPSLALAGLRIELEKSLKTLAINNGINNSRYSVGVITRELYDKNIISNKELSVLNDIIGTLNRAVHGEDFDYRSIEWIINIGPKILDSINNKNKKI